MNQQPTEPPVHNGTGQVLDLHSVFFTLQGEGPFSGERSVFVRLAGCNLQCPGCDTEYTAGRRVVGISEILKLVQAARGDRVVEDGLVVITGGEPLRQPIGPLVDLLLFVGYRVQIESNGTCGPDSMLYNALVIGREDLTLVVSPKTTKIHPECYDLADAFKYVVSHKSLASDGIPAYALEHTKGKGVARPRPGCDVYLTPFDTKDEELNRLNRIAVAQSCLKHGYRAGLQLHKYLELE